MKTSFHGWSRSLLGALATTLLTTSVCAQGLAPAKPLRIIVPIAAGSVTDVVLRAAAPPLGEVLGQPVVIDNRPGASGIVGADACAKAAADGSTVCAVYHATMSFNPFMFDKLPYDPEKDFAPVGRLFFVTEGLVVPAKFAVQSVAELKSYALAHPSGVNLGTLGEGSLQELFVAWLNREWGTQIVGVPYKGGGPIATAVTAGEIQMAQMGLGNFIGLIQAGQVRAIALAGERRSPQLPNVPTMQESGLGGFPSRPWWGIAAPAGTPQATVDRLHQAFATVFKDPKFVQLMEARYVEPAVTTPKEFAAFLKTDREAAGMLVRLSRAK
ncbi:Bug family tripartite tricarboxylate transporter substrate binding protein [Variovorax sp. HJSM1_2]|uniref:Bug family tripartite tricarboxylate transporter substrate binding protein n=1 Tax=Variovorax sp. HJSM1_2 TaxID=3366263 RepID=UPI003BEB1258